MKIKVQTEDKDGNITFDGILNQQEVDFVLNIGINYILANGAMPFFNGRGDEEVKIVSPPPATTQ